MKQKLFNKFILILCLFCSGFLNFIFARPRDFQFEQWCNSLEDDELIVKFKSNSNRLQAQQDFQKAPNFTNQLLSYQKAHDLKHLKRYNKNIKIESMFDLVNEDEIASIDPNFLARKNNFSQARVQFNIDRIYSLRFNSNSYLKSFIPSQQRKIFACQETYKRIKALEQNPLVEYVIPNRILKIQAEITDEYFVSNAPGWDFNYETQWGIKNINAEQAWSKTLGEGALVAVIDSGVNYNHPDLWNNIWVNPKLVRDINQDGKSTLDDLDTNQNHKIDANEFRINTIGFNTSSNNNFDPMDYLGHGTHVAGIIGAVADGQGMVGVAPKARIMIIRVNSDSGAITEKAVARAIILAARQGADVANLSMGSSSHLPLVYDAIQTVKNQMVIVAAAGNNSSYIPNYNRQNPKSFYPAAYKEVVSVAASTPSNKRAYFSNYGPAVTLSAPGGSDNRYEKNIFSTDLTFEGYNRRVGTSMAAPFVTGVVALVLSRKPTESPLKVKRLLISSAIKSTNSSGAGVVNALSAL
jgi:hypothetical protein